MSLVHLIFPIRLNVDCVCVCVCVCVSIQQRTMQLFWQALQCYMKQAMGFFGGGGGGDWKCKTACLHDFLWLSQR